MSTTTGTAVRLDHVAAVTAIYEAFGRGDVPTILELMSPDVILDGDWADNSLQRRGVDHFMPRRGHAEVAAFFQVVGSFTMEDFRILDLTASDRQVVAEVELAFSTPRGGRLRDQELHLWTFGDDGRVVRMRHYVDTAKHLAVNDGVDTTLG